MPKVYRALQQQVARKKQKHSIQLIICCDDDERVEGKCQLSLCKPQTHKSNNLQT